MSRLFRVLKALVWSFFGMSVASMYWFSIMGALFVSFFSHAAGVTAVNWVKFGADMTSIFQPPIWAYLSSLYSVMLIFITAWFLIKVSISVLFPDVNLEKVFDDFLYKSGKKEVSKSE